MEARSIDPSILLHKYTSVERYKCIFVPLIVYSDSFNEVHYGNVRLLDCMSNASQLH